MGITGSSATNFQALDNCGTKAKQLLVVMPEVIISYLAIIGEVIDGEESVPGGEELLHPT